MFRLPTSRLAVPLRHRSSRPAASSTKSRCRSAACRRCPCARRRCGAPSRSGSTRARPPGTACRTLRSWQRTWLPKRASSCLNRTVDSTRIESENHSHANCGLLRKRQEFWFLGSLCICRRGVDRGGFDWGHGWRRQTGGHGQIAREKRSKELHGVLIQYFLDNSI